MELVIASTNSHKVLELREIFRELMPELSLLSLFDFPSYTPPKDEGGSLQERARNKALHAAVSLNKCSLVEQCQLVIPSFGPITYDGTSVVSQTKKILEAMTFKSDLERAAYLESCVSIATPKGDCKEARASTEGMISEKERGVGNGDFDTIFIKYDYSKTLAELSPSTRVRISQRRKAVEKLLHFLHHALPH